MTALWLGLALALDPGVGVEPFGEPPQVEEVDARTLDLATRLRCPVCQGLNVRESTTDAAVAMKARIRDLVAQGYTDEQIVDYFVDRYGAWVLLDPDVEENLAVWVLPAVALVVGLAVLAGLRRSRATPSSSATEQPAAPELIDDPYAARVLAELDE